MFLIDSIGLYPQSAVTLYIYRVGWTYPAKNPDYRSKFMKNPSCTRTPHGPVRPVRPTGRAPARSPTVPDRSDRLVRPVRPVGANFDCQQHHNNVLPSCRAGQETNQSRQETYKSKRWHFNKKLTRFPHFSCARISFSGHVGLRADPMQEWPASSDPQSSSSS